jgi:hypothetical protein
VDTVNVGARVPACPSFIVALRKRGSTAIHNKRSRSRDHFPNRWELALLLTLNAGTYVPSQTSAMLSAQGKQSRTGGYEPCNWKFFAVQLHLLRGRSERSGEEVDKQSKAKEGKKEQLRVETDREAAWTGH